LFRWHRLEHSGRIPNAAKNPWAAEAILDVEATPISRAPSRRASPKLTQLDAFAVSSVSRPAASNIISTTQDSQIPDSFFHTSLLEGQFEGIDTLSYAEGTWSFEDNFSRFMEQAGYATMDQAETLPWVPS